MTTYEKSNSTTEVAYKRLSKEEYKTLLQDKNRSVDAQKLINYLCDKYKIKRVAVRVVNRPRPCYKHGRFQVQKYGHIEIVSGVITIYNLTAKTKKVVSIKSFAETLLHEFIHHYDLEYLKLSETLHTAGFFMRISDLQKKLA